MLVLMGPKLFLLILIKGLWGWGGGGKPKGRRLYGFYSVAFGI